MLNGPRSLIGRAIDYFSPDEYNLEELAKNPTEEYRKARLTLGFTLISFPCVMGMYILRLIFDSHDNLKFIFVLPLISAVGMTGLFMIKKFKMVKTLLFVAFNVTMTIIPLRILQTGGITSGIIEWYAVIPVIAALVYSYTAAIVIGLVAAVQLFLIANIDKLGYAIPPKVISPNVQAIIITLALWMVTGLAAFFEYSRVKQQALLEKNKKRTEYLNTLLNMIMDNVNQGFFLFFRNGECAETCSKKTIELLEQDPRSQKIWDVLAKGEEDREILKTWVELLYSGKHALESIFDLAPEMYEHSLGKLIFIEYYPVFREDKLYSVVVVVTDRTEQIKAKEEAESQRNEAQMVLNMAQNVQLFIRFHETFNEFVFELKEQLRKFYVQWPLVQRLLHNLKGGAGSLAMFPLSNRLHEMENMIAEGGKGSERDLVDALMRNLKVLEMEYEEIISRFSELLGSGFDQQTRYRKLSENELEDFYKKLQAQEIEQNLIKEFKDKFLKEPIGLHFHQFQNIVKNLAQDLGKEIEPIQFQGDDLLISATPYFRLFESTVHAFRNAVDHGVEPRKERLEKGKDPRGKISVSFSLHQEKLHLKIADDGRGIDPQELKKLWLDRHREDLVADKSDEEILQLIFESDFSTKSEVTEISGRGVGMEAIRFEATKLGGKVWVESKINCGTELNVEVPLING